MSAIDFEDGSLHLSVLCVNRYLHYILAGIGNSLFVFHKTLVLTQSVFIDERVHSILLKDDLILVKGCRQLSLMKIKLNCDKICVEIISSVQCSDLIQDVVITNEDLVGLVTAHNCFQLWDLKLKKCVETQQCVENCLLYSCKITGNSMNTMTVFAGTVFGDVLMWAPSLNEGKLLKRLNAHNGAVFSIEVKPNEKLMSTTSDDRSLKIWSVSSEVPLSNPQTWKESNVYLRQTLFGHTARVWKSLILEKYFVTIGEDSQLILWSRGGQVVRTLSLHQESGIRGLHYSPDGMITTGGEDSGINMFSLEWLSCPSAPEGVDLVADGSTKVSLTNQGILYVVNGSCVLDNEVIYKNDHFGSYSVLEVAPMYVFMGSVKGRLIVLNLETKSVLVDEQAADGRIYSIHWMKGYILTCGPEGRLDLWALDEGLTNIRTMTLPPSKERWTTCAILYREMLILGDRMGSVHVFDRHPDPVKSFRKIHSFLGVTDIQPSQEGWVSVGRDGTIKTFTNLTHSLTYKLPMDWPWRIVRHGGDTLILGFHSTLFIVWSMNYREIIASHDCGGGHRSCDFKLSNHNLTFLYVKDKKVKKVNLTLNNVTRIRNGYHGKEINCLKILQTRPAIIVTGSEDTTLRISAIQDDIQPLQVLTSHISSVRGVLALPISSHEHLITSVGGKGQIVIYKFNLNTKQCELIINHRLKTETRNWKTLTPSIDPETRVMCVDIQKLESRYVLATGCSDCYIRLFHYCGKLNESGALSYTHCILNIKFVGNLLVSMGTDGKVVFWDYLKAIQLKSFQLHQSGINSFHVEKVEKGKFILATGGDDNLICVAGVEILEEEVNLTQLWRNSVTHSCQITGMKILKNYLITSSIDQRITVWRWAWEEEFQIEFLNQFMTAVPDIQGMDATWCDTDTLMAIVHGKGIQVMKIDLHSPTQAHC